MFMANVASAIVSMRFGFQGPCYCTVSACASSGHALGDAFDLIRENKADVIVAGGSEAAITPLALASFANMKALSERNDDPKTASRPFDKDRDGFVMGDGAAVVILELVAAMLFVFGAAGLRKAGFQLAHPHFFDTVAVKTQATQADELIAAAAARRMNLRRIDPHTIGISLDETCSREDLENILAVFGGHARKLIFGSTKSMTGHLLGAAGAFEFAICALALRDGVIPPTINQFNPDPACDLDSAPNHAVKRQFDVALSNSFGFGGHNVTLAVRRVV